MRDEDRQSDSAKVQALRVDLARVTAELHEALAMYRASSEAELRLVPEAEQLRRERDRFMYQEATIENLESHVDRLIRERDEAVDDMDAAYDQVNEAVVVLREVRDRPLTADEIATLVNAALARLSTPKEPTDAIAALRGPVHNHGPHEGPGLGCHEYKVGACIADAALARLSTPKEPEVCDYHDEYDAECYWCVKHVYTASTPKESEEVIPCMMEETACQKS